MHMYVCASLVWGAQLPGHQYLFRITLFYEKLFFSSRSEESYVIGFVVPNQKHFLALAEQYGVRGSRKELCNSRTMEELVLKAITETPLAGADITSQFICAHCSG